MTRIYIGLSLALIFAGSISCATKTQADPPPAEALIPPMPSDSSKTDHPPIPDLQLTALDGKPFTLKSLGENPVVMFFDPECDHCQRECKAIRSRLSEFRSYPLLLVSIETSERVREFRDEYDLKDPVFSFATGDLKAILTAVGPIPSVPCFYIYRKGKLHLRLEGEVEIDELLAGLK